MKRKHPPRLHRDVVWDRLDVEGTDSCLQIGAAAETTALWLDTSTWMLKPLHQVYRRKSESLFGYSSPLHGYHADLSVDSDGIVLDYPELWTVKRS